MILEGSGGVGKGVDGGFLVNSTACAGKMLGAAPKLNASRRQRGLRSSAFYRLAAST